MACLRTVVFLALLCAVTSAIEVKRPPPDLDNKPHGYHGEHNPFYTEGANNYLANDRDHAIDPNTQVNEEDRKFYKPYFYYPYHPLVHRPHPAPETQETEEAVDSTESLPEEQEASDLANVEVEPESETQIDEAVPFDDPARIESRKSYEVSCDFLTVPKYSCYSCYTYLVCKSEGGKVKSCSEPTAPYCNNGVCSSTPSAECVQNSSAMFY